MENPEPKAPIRASLEQRDRAWAVAVRGYRKGPREQWAPALLELGERWIQLLARRFHALGPAIDQEDLRSQLVVALLETALTLPLDSERYLERRIQLRAANRVSRWLQAEARRQVRTVSLEALEVLAEEAL